MKSKLNNIFKYLLILILSLFIGISFYNWNNKTLNGDIFPMPFNIGLSIIKTGSMEPTLKVNDLIIVKKENEYNVGDIIVYQDKNQLVCHRIVFIDDSIVITKGDYNNNNDLPININQIKGKVIKNYHKIGYLIKQIKSPLGITIILLLGLFLLKNSYRNQDKNDLSITKIKEEIKKLKEEINNKQ